MDDPSAPRSHARIVSVGIRGQADRYDVESVARWIRSGEHSFYTTNTRGEHPRMTEVCPCANRTRPHIRSVPDAHTDNNLESQPGCP